MVIPVGARIRQLVAQGGTQHVVHKVVQRKVLWVRHPSGGTGELECQRISKLCLFLCLRPGLLVQRTQLFQAFGKMSTVERI